MVKNLGEKPRISRRRFLKLAIAAGIFSKELRHLADPKKLFAQTTPEESESMANEDLTARLDQALQKINIEGEIEPEKNRLEEINNIKRVYSTPLRQIPHEVRFMHRQQFYTDFSQLPRYEDIQKEKDVSIKMLMIIKLLSVQSKEEIIASIENFKKLNSPLAISKSHLIDVLKGLNNLYGETRGQGKDFKNLWEQLFPDIKILEDLPKLEKAIGIIRQKIEELITWYYQLINNFAYAPGVESWNQQASCNIYATSVMAMLGLSDKLSYWTDTNGVPLTCKTNRGRITWVRPDGTKFNGRPIALRAKGVYDWLGKNGKNYGWEEVTEKSYNEKVQMLKDGYIFYGCADHEEGDGHNWIVWGLKDVSDNVQPMLTQATFNVSMAPFFPEEYIYTEAAQQQLPSSLRRNSDNYAGGYKLLPGAYGEVKTKLYAIKVG